MVRSEFLAHQRDEYCQNKGEAGLTERQRFIIARFVSGRGVILYEIINSFQSTLITVTTSFMPRHTSPNTPQTIGWAS